MSSQENRTVLDVVQDVCADYKAAVLTTDVCPGCLTDYGDWKHPILVSLSLRAGEKTYEYCCICLCSSCVKKQDYNLIKRNLNHLIMECPAYEINNS